MSRVWGGWGRKSSDGPSSSRADSAKMSEEAWESRSLGGGIRISCGGGTENIFCDCFVWPCEDAPRRSSKSAANVLWATLLWTLSASFSIRARRSGDTTVSLGGGDSAGGVRGVGAFEVLVRETDPLPSTFAVLAEASAAKRRFSFLRSFSRLVRSGSLSLAAARRKRLLALEKKFLTVR